MPETAKTFKYDNVRPIPGVAFTFKGSKANDPYLVNLQVKVLDDGTVVPDESDVKNLDDIIQTYKDQCGMEMALRLIKLGQIDPHSLADDGKHGYDARLVPEDAQGIANAAIAAKGNAESLYKAFGIDPGAQLTEDQIDSLIKEYISKNLDRFVKPQVEVVKTDGGDK